MYRLEVWDVPATSAVVAATSISARRVYSNDTYFVRLSFSLRYMYKYTALAVVAANYMFVRRGYEIRYMSG